MHNRDISFNFSHMTVYCVFSLESPHEYTQYTICNTKKKITMNYPNTAAIRFFLGIQVRVRNSSRFLFFYTTDCPPVRGDNPRALASGLSPAQADKPWYNLNITLFFTTDKGIGSVIKKNTCICSDIESIPQKAKDSKPVTNRALLVCFNFYACSAHVGTLEMQKKLNM